MKKLFFLALSAFALTSCHENLEDRAERECNDYTKRHCPVPITDNTVLDSMVFERASRTIHYYYDLKVVADTSSTTIENAKKDIIEGLRNSTTERAYKEAGFNFAYTYYSMSHGGKKVVDVVVTEKDYK